MSTSLILGILLVGWLCWRLGALDSLTNCSLKIETGWTATKNVTGSDYAPNSNSTRISKSLTIGTSVANAAAGGGDELYSAVTSLAAGASASIDLTAFTNILNAAAASMARVKAIVIRVLSVADDAAIGTAATPVMIDTTVANGLVSQSGTGWFKAATSTFDIPNGGILAFGTPAAGGVLIDATHKIIKITNSDGAVTAKVQITAIGGSS